MAEKLIAEAVAAHLGERLLSARPLGGGCIGEVYKVELEDGTSLVAKVDKDAEAHLEREAYMLRYLREHSDLPVPEVFHGSETLLLMEFVEGASRFSDGAERHAAELLAGLHSISAETYGHERDTLIGSLDQPNPPTENWGDFFREHRLLYMADVAHNSGRLLTEDRRRINSLAGKLEGYIEEPNPPSLIHGDVWSANVLAKDDRVAAFLDPAIYFADPEGRVSNPPLLSSPSSTPSARLSSSGTRRFGGYVPASSRCAAIFTISIRFSCMCTSSAAGMRGWFGGRWIGSDFRGIPACIRSAGWRIR